MPKSKTHSGAKKRFKVTGSGKIKREKPFHSHMLTTKPSKRKRSLRQSAMMNTTDSKMVKKLLGE
ncbi:MAG TPA: 50S ribosomal protein L35 [Candidatus Kapabacteria bacterium]|nr:50S ribosomal protein L35 [Candidatus Kapabacteria bacterium]